MSLTILVACSGDRSIGPAGSALAGVSIDTSVTARYRKDFASGKLEPIDGTLEAPPSKARIHPPWEDEVDAKARGVRIWWTVEHACGLSVSPRVGITSQRISMSVTVTGSAGACAPELTCFLTSLGSVPPATYQVEAPRLRASVVVPP